MPAKAKWLHTIFSPKVCDSYGSCREFSEDFAVETKETFTIEEAHELKSTLVDEEKYKRELLMVNFPRVVVEKWKNKHSLDLILDQRPFVYMSDVKFF